ncbi:MAG: amidohydrolase [Chitinophagales bacterium]|nr:amidohydrolase [Chitinophagales bacterium]
MSHQEKIKELSSSLHQEVVSWRQRIHANPELAFKEVETAAFISSILGKYQIEHQKEIAKTGIVALIKGKNPESKCIALRADMDALPIQETNTAPYASKNPGVMHACGHDFHSANLLGVAVILNSLKEEFEGTIKLIFQPSEEKIPSGAEAMIAAGVLENPKVVCIIGQHVSPELPTGSFGFKSGQFMASADELYLKVKGKGGHAAFPNLLVDPVYAAAQIIISLQQILSRKKSPFATAVLSFGKVEALGATNVIPDEVNIAGTLRTMDENFRAEAHQWISQIAEETAKASGASCEVSIVKGNPSLFNDEALSSSCFDWAKAYDADLNIQEIPARMGGEDFAWYSQKIPALFYRVGTGNVEKDSCNGLHTSNFKIDEEAFLHSLGLMSWLALNALKENSINEAK